MSSAMMAWANARAATSMTSRMPNLCPDADDPAPRDEGEDGDDRCRDRRELADRAGSGDRRLVEPEDDERDESRRDEGDGARAQGERLERSLARRRAVGCVRRRAVPATGGERRFGGHGPRVLPSGARGREVGHDVPMSDTGASHFAESWTRPPSVAERMADGPSRATARATQHTLTPHRRGSRSPRHPRSPEPDARARARPLAHGAHVGEPLRVLPRHGGDPGRRYGGRSAHRHPRPLLRRRARRELRVLRLAAADARLRPQRLRRGRLGAVGVGSQAPHHECRDRRTGHRPRRSRRDEGRPRGDPHVRPRNDRVREAQSARAVLPALRGGLGGRVVRPCLARGRHRGHPRCTEAHGASAP